MRKTGSTAGHDGASNGTGDHQAAQTAFEDFTRNIQRRRKRSWPTCSLSAATASRARRSSRSSKDRRLDGTIHVHAEAARSTRSVTA